MRLDISKAVNAVLDGLRNDAVLAGYVKKISHGNMNYSRSQFPFIEIGNIRMSEKEAGVEGAVFLLTIEVLAGTRNLAPGLAYRGDGDTKKGITHLCNDIKNVIQGNTFGGAFDMPVERINVDPIYHTDSGNTLYIGRIVFTGDIWVGFHG